jgi:hypothetical protein
MLKGSLEIESAYVSVNQQFFVCRISISDLWLTKSCGTGGNGRGNTLPAHCRVDGIMDRRTGAGGDTCGIGLAVSLPENWNGRFLQQGGGGLKETAAEPLGRDGSGNQQALLRGSAVATNDA